MLKHSSYPCKLSLISQVTVVVVNIPHLVEANCGKKLNEVVRIIIIMDVAQPWKRVENIGFFFTKIKASKPYLWEKDDVSPEFL